MPLVYVSFWYAYNHYVSVTTLFHSVTIGLWIAGITGSMSGVFVASVERFPAGGLSAISRGMPPERLTIHVRVPPSLLKAMKLAAVENDRSMNAEIVARLERSFSIDDANRTQALKLLGEVVSLLDKGSG